MAKHTIGVIGAGQMGGGIAQVFAYNGHPVLLLDVNEHLIERGLQTIGSSLDRLIKKGTIGSDQKQRTLDRITPTTDLKQFEQAQVVIEAATERRDLKFDLFRQLDQICSPATILASNTSSISITEIAAQTQRPDQVIGMHFLKWYLISTT